jgi:hypothetical protein
MQCLQLQETFTLYDWFTDASNSGKPGILGSVTEFIIFSNINALTPVNTEKYLWKIRSQTRKQAVK